MSFETLNVRREDAVLRVSIAAPPLNLMSRQMVMELFGVAGSLIEDRSIRVVVVDSAVEDFFIAHFDLAEMIASMKDPDTPQSEYADINIMQSLATTWQALPQVTVAQVDGFCRGAGVEFILGLDMRFASLRSSFCLPEASAGFLACGGGATRVLMSCGPARGLEFLLTGRDFSAAEAERYGLVNRALPDEDLDAYVEDAVSRLARRSPRVVAMHQQVTRAVFGGMADAMFAGFAAENEGMRCSLERPDVLGFLENSAPKSQTPELERDLPGFLERATADTPFE